MKFNTLVLDCDGVILDSNRVKTDAFYSATLPYGEQAAAAMVDYHVRNGGVSRYRKFAYFLEHLAPAGVVGPDLDALLAAYASEVRAGLLTCAVAPGLEALRQHTSAARWLVASGGDQAELREVFEARGLLSLFDGGIFGSPDAKEDIVKRELENGNIRSPALFIGDSRYDHVVAQQNGLDFVFLTGWSEFKGWEDYFAPYQVLVKNSIKDLMPCVEETH
ncbi:HAD family hydrolase [Ectopseudomonas oleovorans]|uniref:phosphoglycolate phosphatase n=1 Tax=Ectopseudomonas oleovorans (strain CECT 5344) TaxID=1182590 RepID=W6QV07_ECTO5|nr:HAD family hydrolase [Pseudomonas oleovorans]CDM40282.1 hydrolase, haloacid dehalogenase-like family [Pseudomonas oleovorans CECT 5344]CDR90912.1 hydrolase, haloacid dehalogenase-like family [Pseudomonas oleovorans]